MNDTDKKFPLQPVYDTGFDDGYLQRDYEKCLESAAANDAQTVELQTQLLAEIKNLENEIKALKAQESRQPDPHNNARIQSLEASLNRLVNEYNNFEFQKNYMVDRVAELNNKARFFKDELKRLQQENAAFVNSRYANWADFQSNYQLKLDQFQALIDQQNQTIKQLNEQIAANQGLIDQNVQRLQQNHSLDQQERDALLYEVDHLYNELYELENQKRLVGIEYEATYQDLVSADAELQNVYETIAQNQANFQKQCDAYWAQLKQVEQQIQTTKQELVDEESTLKVRLNDADFYINSRLAELDDLTSKINERDFVSKEQAQDVKASLANLTKEKERLSAEKDSFERLRNTALNDINRMEQENALFAKHLEQQQYEFERKQQESLLKLETEHKQLQKRIGEFKIESEAKSEALLIQERELLEKRREIDDLLTQASLEYEQQRRTNQVLKEKHRQVQQHFQNLVHAKKKLDQKRHYLAEQKRIDEEQIFKLKEKIATERRELEKLYLVKKQKQDQKENDLLIFEKQLRQYQADFENEIEEKQNELFASQKSLQKSFTQLKNKEAELNQKAQKIAEDWAHLKQNKHHHADLEIFLEGEFNHLQQEKHKLLEARTQFDNRVSLLSARFKQKQAELVKQKQSLEQLTAAFNKEQEAVERDWKDRLANLEKQKEMLGDKVHQFDENSLNISKKLAERELAIKFKEKELEAAQKQLSLDNNNNAGLKLQLDKLSESLKTERLELEASKERILDFYDESSRRIADYESDLQARLAEVKTLEKNQQETAAKSERELKVALEKLNQAKKAFLQIRKQQLLEIASVKQQLAQKANLLKNQQAELDKQTEELEAAFLEQDTDKKELEKALHSVKSKQELLERERSFLIKSV